MIWYVFQSFIPAAPLSIIRQRHVTAVTIITRRSSRGIAILADGILDSISVEDTARQSGLTLRRGGGRPMTHP